MLDPAGRAFVLALHSAKDGGRDEKPLRDLERALEILPLELWRAAAEIAAEVGGGEAFAAGLRRCLRPGARWLRSWASPRTCRARSRCGRRTLPPSPWASTGSCDRRGLDSKVALVARKIVPPPAFLREWSPLARRGRWGLALDLPLAADMAALEGSGERCGRWSSRAPGHGEAVTASRRRSASRLSVWSKVMPLRARIWWTFVTVIGVERRHPLPQAVARLGDRITESTGPGWSLDASGGSSARSCGSAGGGLGACSHALVLYRLLREQGDHRGTPHRDAARSSIQGRSRMGGSGPGRCGSAPRRARTSSSRAISLSTRLPGIECTFRHAYDVVKLRRQRLPGLLSEAEPSLERRTRNRDSIDREVPASLAGNRGTHGCDRGNRLWRPDRR